MQATSQPQCVSISVVTSPRAIPPSRIKSSTSNPKSNANMFHKKIPTRPRGTQKPPSNQQPTLTKTKTIKSSSRTQSQERVTTLVNRHN